MLALLITCRHCFWMIEQPSSSMFEKLPYYEHVRGVLGEFMKVHKTFLFLGFDIVIRACKGLMRVSQASSEYMTCNQVGWGTTDIFLARAPTHMERCLCLRVIL